MPSGEEDVATVLPVAPWLGAALLVVLVVALNVPAPERRGAAARVPGSPLAHPAAGAVALAAAFGLALVARLGARDELDNPVPALVVGLGWPLLWLVPAAVQLVRRTASADDDAAGAPRDVRPALAGAVAVTAYLALVPRPSTPRTLAVAIGVYALGLLGVGIALGRAAVARTDVLGLVARWSALGPRLVRWHPPRGAAAVLAVLLGGAWAERAQRTSAWFERTPGRPAQVLLVVVAVAVAGGAALALTSWSDGRAAPVLLPLTAAAVVASVLRRAVISAQLLWDQTGLGRPGLDPDPLGLAGGQAAALAVATLGGAVAALVLARRVGGGSARLPGTGVVLALTGVTGGLVLAP